MHQLRQLTRRIQLSNPEGKSASGRKRGIALAALCAAASLGLGACGGNDDSASASGGIAGTGEKVTLQYAIWDEAQQKTMKEVAAAFTKDHPEVTINIQLTDYDNYFTKLQTSVSGNSGPDVFWMNGPSFQLYASNGMLAPIDVDAAKYPEALVNLYSYDGQTYGAPKDFDTIAVCYNKAIFDAAGVNYPQDGWTWADYLEIAEKLTDKDKGIWGSGAPISSSQKTIYNTIPQAGGEVINADGTTAGFGTDAAYEGVNFWYQQVESGVSPTQQQMVDTSAKQLFDSGKIAMLWDGSWAPGPLADNEVVGQDIDFAPLPAGKAGNQSVIHGIGNVVNAKSKNLEIAKEFALFASGQTAAEIMANEGSVIPAYQGMQETWQNSLPQYNLQVYIDALETAVPYPVSKNTPVWVADETESMTQIWSGQVSLKDGLADLNATMQKALDAEN